MMSATRIIPLAPTVSDSQWPPAPRQIIRAEIITGFLFRTLILASGCVRRPFRRTGSAGWTEVIPGPGDYRDR